MWNLILSGFIFFSIGSISFAGDSEYSYKNRTGIRPNDYLFKNQEAKKDPVFEEYRSVDLGINLGVGSDCGRVDFKSTLQATLKNILDSKYFGDMGKDILGGSPMLVACYFSPTWCAILKHSQINANFMSQMRLNQCALMDKYTDSRVEDFYEERQLCVHKEIDKNGGNIESAMQTCNSNKVWDTDLQNWSGDKYGGKASSNKLIESSARWAGFDTEKGSGAVKLVQSLVGDTVISRGKISVEYGDKPFGLTPRTHLAALQRDIHERICVDLMQKFDDAGQGNAINVIRDADIKGLSGSDQLVLDRQTLGNLAVLPRRTRAVFCQRLAASLATTKFAEDMNRSLDILSVASQNPNLPDRRKKEIIEKRDALKQSVDTTIELQREQNAPLNEVTSQINLEGEATIGGLASERIGSERVKAQNKSAKGRYFDCADGVMCADEKGQ